MLRDCPGCDELEDKVPRQNRVQSDLCCCTLWGAQHLQPSHLCQGTHPELLLHSQADDEVPRPPTVVTLLSPQGLKLALHALDPSRDPCGPQKPLLPPDSGLLCPGSASQAPPPWSALPGFLPTAAPKAGRMQVVVTPTGWQAFPSQAIGLKPQARVSSGFSVEGRGLGSGLHSI